MRADLAEERRQEAEEYALLKRIIDHFGITTGSVTVHAAGGKPKLVDTSKSARIELRL